jgi:antitoxin component of RelBE/YafQ-DinJ toxin-antitoxin module
MLTRVAREKRVPFEPRCRTPPPSRQWTEARRWLRSFATVEDLMADLNATIEQTGQFKRDYKREAKGPHRQTLASDFAPS